MSKSGLMRLNTDMRVNRIADEVWEIPASEKAGMLVPARVYATQTILQSMDRGVFDQVTNVACLPGIQRYALCMPDGHWGYGFPIGGVAAFDARHGVISPGGVGYDVNCGMRLIRTNLSLMDVQPRLERLMTELFRRVPDCRLNNHYGQSESAMVTVHTLTGPSDGWPVLPPIGRPLPGCE